MTVIDLSESVRTIPDARRWRRAVLPAGQRLPPARAAGVSPVHAEGALRRSIA
ncbi:MAG: hypothetical protein IT495_02200 [Gammaproteobacteria bacterium]|nr:hypothetical protein [Gammaproteobacteria bacterium]